MSVVDDRTFTLALNAALRPGGIRARRGGAPIAGIMREADAKRPNNVPLTNPVGSGPFIYNAAMRESGHRVVFDRNPDYPARSSRLMAPPARAW